MGKRIENKILLQFQRLLFNSQPEVQFRIPNHFKFQCQFQSFQQEVPGPEASPWLWETSELDSVVQHEILEL